MFFVPSSEKFTCKSGENGTNGTNGHCLEDPASRKTSGAEIPDEPPMVACWNHHTSYTISQDSRSSILLGLASFILHFFGIIAITVLFKTRNKYMTKSCYSKLEI